MEFIKIGKLYLVQHCSEVYGRLNEVTGVL